jgi:predicted DNA-binding protein
MSEKRGLKNRVAISNAVDKELYQKLKNYSDKTSIPISKLLDKAIAMFLETVE